MIRLIEIYVQLNNVFIEKNSTKMSIPRADEEIQEWRTFKHTTNSAITVRVT
jgi:hypothetical protein